MIDIVVDPFPAADALDALWTAAWGSSARDYSETVLPRSLVHLGAYSDAQLVGFVNVAWDGGAHAFLLDPTVHPEFQRRGIATRLVKLAADKARERGAHWLHVDFEPHLAGFYAGCGFRPTGAGLIRL